MLKRYKFPIKLNVFFEMFKDTYIVNYFSSSQTKRDIGEVTKQIIMLITIIEWYGLFKFCHYYVLYMEAKEEWKRPKHY